MDVVVEVVKVKMGLPGHFLSSAGTLRDVKLVSTRAARG